MRLWVLLALLLPLTANAQPDEKARTLQISATGTVIHSPNQVQILLAVETFAPTAQEATSKNASRMSQVMYTLKRLVLPAGQVQTTSYSLEPRYENDPEHRRRKPEPVGFVAHNMVQVVLDSINQVGNVLDAAITHGVNRAADLRFQLKNPETAYLEALREAVRQARAQAEVLAEASGQKLGSVLSINTSGNGPMPRFARAEALYKSADTPIEGHTIETSATVHITYQLQD
ncbi:MAG: SIMPL domain-containing protein [bacterium]|nr:SIMPL domain-containing protein [bacterium]